MTTASAGRSRKATVAAAFGAAADSYESGAGVQQEVAARLAARIAALALPADARILEIGCGTGFLGRALAPALPAARWLFTDLSPAMLARCRRDWTGGPAAFAAMDGERPCLAEGGFDLVCASLALQWFAQPATALAAWSRLLRPGGALAVATLAEGSFQEWIDAHADLGLGAGVPAWPNLPHLQSLWPPGGSGRFEIEDLAPYFPDAHGFLSGLKRIGAHTPAAGHRPLAPGALRRILRRFAPPGGLTVTYRIAYGVFRKGGP